VYQFNEFSGANSSKYGLGSMGIGMALNLQNYLSSIKSGQLHFSNRTLSKGDSLKAAGAVPEDDFLSLIRSSDVIFTMVQLHPVTILARLIDIPDFE
jgi:3-hydroxyisobutyrate dehydrogenase-like beta-hydroxyacid dehydrogenase